MRPITHPHMKDVTVEGILHAFSDPVRVFIYAEIAMAECPQMCSNFLKAKGKDLPKSTLSQHFKILRDAGLIKSVKQGVTLHNTTRCEELYDRFGPLVKNILEAYASQDKKKKRRSANEP